jgi:hypothetical protein
VTGADRKNYRVDTYITTLDAFRQPALKTVTVVVRDGSKLSARPLARVAVDVRRVDGQLALARQLDL